MSSELKQKMVALGRQGLAQWGITVPDSALEEVATHYMKWSTNPRKSSIQEEEYMLSSTISDLITYWLEDLKSTELIRQIVSLRDEEVPPPVDDIF